MRALLLLSDRDSRARLPSALALFAAIFLEGLLLTSIGPTLDALADQTASSTEAIAILFTANSLGYVVGSVWGGRIFSRMPGNPVVSGALFAMSALAAVIPLIGSLPLLALTFAFAGAAVSLVDVGANTLIVWLYGPGVPPYLNALHLCFGMGAFLCPLIVDRFAVITGNAAAAFWLFAGLMIPVAVWLLRVPSPARPEDAAGIDGSPVVRRYAWFVGSIGLLYLLFAGSQLAFAGWVFSYAEELAIGGATTARVLNSAFWGGLVLGRLLAIPASRRLSSRAMLQTSLIGSAVALGSIAVLGDWIPALWIGTIGFGMMIAPMFATGISYAGEYIPITSRVTATFIVGAGIGSMSLPWVVGQFFDRRGPETMIWIVGGAIAAGIVLFSVIQIHAERMGRRAPDGPGSADATARPI